MVGETRNPGPTQHPTMRFNIFYITALCFGTEYYFVNRAGILAASTPISPVSAEPVLFPENNNTRYGNPAEIDRKTIKIDIEEPQINIDGSEPVCPGNYVHLETSDGGNFAAITEDEATGRLRLRLRRQRLRHKNPSRRKSQQIALTSDSSSSTKTTTRQPESLPTIAIVRQGRSSVAFKIKNPTWTDKFGSKRCMMANDFRPVEVVGAEASFAVIQVYAHFDHADNNKPSVLEVPTSCLNPHDDNSSSKVIEYTFQLICLLTCDNHIEYIDGATLSVTAPLSEQSEMSSVAHASKSKPSITNFVSEPLKKQNRVKSADSVSTQNKNWDKMYQRLVAFKNEHNGDTNVPYDQDPQLGDWVYTQRKVYKRKKMTKERASLLNSIGFRWRALQTSGWDEMYQRLLAYKTEHKGDVKVPVEYNQDPQLGRWVHNQRIMYKRKKMSTERASLLNSIGFHWSAPQSAWNKMYQRLAAFKNEHNGDTNVPQKYDRDPQLGNWVHHQRLCYNKKKMPTERASLLNSIDFEWEAPQTDWNEMYQRLVAFKNEHNGDTKVPQKYDRDPQLGNWVHHQRLYYNKKQMSTERASLLNSIGFEWKAPEGHWNEMYQRLVAYRNEHNGDTKVPRKYDQDPQLGYWVNTQRAVYNKKQMSEKRASLLDSIGFDWEAHSTNWDRMYQRLVVYKIEHNGDTKVPVKYERDPQLGKWVSNQRQAYKEARMPSERASLLNSIGFDWNVRAGSKTKRGAGAAHSSSWDEMYQRLVAYKNHHDDIKVPQIYNQDPQLENWVHHQRLHYKRKKMTTKRASLLNAIGFDWEIKPIWNTNPASGAASGAGEGAGASDGTVEISTSIQHKNWNEMYKRVVAYKAKHNGDTKVPVKYEQDPQLGHWVHNQRRFYKKKKLLAERVSLLNSIGFDWGVSLHSRWDEMYQRLVTYKHEHNGDTKVPRGYDQDPKLGNWVSNQRQAYKNAKMTTEHASLLNSIGFDWEILPGRITNPTASATVSVGRRPAIASHNAAIIGAGGAGVGSGSGSGAGAGAGAGAVGTSDDGAAAAAAEFRAAAARLRDLAHSANVAPSYDLDNSFDDTADIYSFSNAADRTAFIESARKSADRADDIAEKGCNNIRRTSRVMRMLCAAKKDGSAINLKIVKSEISETYSKSVAKVGSFDELASVNIVKKLFRKKFSKSVMKVAMPFF